MNERQHDVLCNVSALGVASLTLNRVEKHNAFDGVMIAHLLVELERLSADPSVRVLVLQANGQHFPQVPICCGCVQWLGSQKSTTIKTRPSSRG